MESELVKGVGCAMKSQSTGFDIRRRDVPVGIYISKIQMMNQYRMTERKSEFINEGNTRQYMRCMPTLRLDGDHGSLALEYTAFLIGEVLETNHACHFGIKIMITAPR
jgi:hypothetical protein